MDFLNSLGDTVKGIGNSIIGILPKSPFVFLDANPQIKEVLGFLNWFMPIDTMIAITEPWLTAIGIYYVLQAILRWANIIE